MSGLLNQLREKGEYLPIVNSKLCSWLSEIINQSGDNAILRSKHNPALWWNKHGMWEYDGKYYYLNGSPVTNVVLNGNAFLIESYELIKIKVK